MSDQQQHQQQPETKEDDLISCIQSLVQQEESLTRALSIIKPLLSLPTPTTNEQAQTILALARTYSTRTSAPPGWNPTLPVAHFATPSPYPHQLRGGALGALQLTLVREERMRKKRKIMEEEEEKKRQTSMKLKKGSSIVGGTQQLERRRRAAAAAAAAQQDTMNLSSSSSSEEEDDDDDSQSEEE